MAGKVNEAYIYTFAVEGSAGPRAGIAAVDFTITVRNPQDTASNSPTVSEVGGGMYRFTIPASFTNTHSIGQYGITVELDTTAPIQQAVFGDTLEFFVSDFDDVANDVWNEALSTHNVAGSAGRSQVLMLYDNGEAVSIHINDGGVAGTVVGINGTVDNPVNNVADARTLADALGIRAYTLETPNTGITLASTHDNWRFYGGEIDPGGQDVSGSQFHRSLISGSVASFGGPISIFDGFVDGPVNLSTFLAFRTGFEGDVTLETFAQLVDCYQSASPVGLAAADVVFIFPTAQAELIVMGYNGDLKILSMTNVNALADIHFKAGQLILDSTNTDGDVRARGIFELNDTSNGTTVDTAGRVGEVADVALTAVHGAGSWTAAAVVQQRQLRQAWSRRVNPTSEMRAIVHLEDGDGNRVALAGGAAMTFQGYDRAGALIAGFSGSGVLRTPVAGDTYFDASVAFAPVSGSVIVIKAIITGSGVGTGVHTGFTEVAFAEF